jgi:outer membrane protein assembly factor BamD (BamD/ComL family)
MKTFIEANEMDNALAVSDYISNRTLNDEANRELAIIRAYYYQRTNRLPEMATQLQNAIEYMKSDERRARLSFTLGQVLQTIGSDSLAYIYYKDAVRNSKTYEMSFYSRLNMSQVSQANSNASEREIRKYFKKLIRDPKNEEYHDRILYELGGFEYKNGMLDAAISNFKASAKANRSNTRLKSYTYLKLAEIYYDDLRDYRLAKSYYDSTVSIYPKESEKYMELENRAEVLTDFVTYYETIHNGDSLLALASLPSDSLNLWIEELLDIKEIETIEEKEKQEKEQRREAIFGTSSTTQNENFIDLSATNEGTWYFYNTSELSKGFSSFKLKWGQRPLEDNWRRSLKTGGSETAPETTKAEKTDDIITSIEPGTDAIFDRKSEKQNMLSSIPFDIESQRSLLSEIENATYEIGKIYNFRLEEKHNAITTFEEYIYRFDTSRHIPEVLYQLFLLNKNRDSLKSVLYFNQLIQNHDTSIYAKLAINPNFINERDQENENYKKIYVKAYDLYENGMSKESQKLIDSALISKPINEYVDNLHLLTAMNYGEIEGIYKYQFELSNFIKSHGESDLVPYAEKLLKTSQDYQINLYSSSKAKFIKNFDTKHYFILVYPLEEELTSQIPNAVEEILVSEEYSLVTGNMVLDEDHAVVLVNEFIDKLSAESFLNLYLNKERISTKFVPAKFYPMVITDENFQIFFETKDLESYITFFSKNYKK